MHFATLSHPVFSCAEAAAFERKLFGGNEAAEWSAMQRAGRALGAHLLCDASEIGAWPPDARILVLVGKGHNGGDALLAAQTILEKHPSTQADIVFAFAEKDLKPLTMRAWRDLTKSAGARLRLRSRRDGFADAYMASIDGVFGFQFRSPLDVGLREWFQHINRLKIRLRAAVDLPSGLGEADAIRADFTYGTGSVKSSVLDSSNRAVVGRIRYLDIGFFDQVPAGNPSAGRRVLSSRTLDPLRDLRAPGSDKRSFGHLLVVAGSRGFPGAAMMCVRAALQSGVGLLTAFIPESLVSAYAAQVPEAMWLGCPETPNGGLALEGLHLLRGKQGKFDALVIGPGLAREAETLNLADEILNTLKIPAVIDADALQPQLVKRRDHPCIVTPHAGEFKRIAGNVGLLDYARDSSTVTVLKGPVTSISDGVSEYVSLAGGPVLARGGSGDMLAGIIGGVLAQQPTDPLGAACLGTLWHGAAADALARAHGQNAVRSTQLLDYLSTALRESSAL